MQAQCERCKEQRVKSIKELFRMRFNNGLSLYAMWMELFSLLEIETHTKRIAVQWSSIACYFSLQTTNISFVLCILNIFTTFVDVDGEFVSNVMLYVFWVEFVILILINDFDNYRKRWSHMFLLYFLIII